MKLNEEVDDNLSFVRTNHRRDSSTSLLTIIKHTLYGLRCSCVLNFLIKEFVVRVRVSEVHNK